MSTTIQYGKLQANTKPLQAYLIIGDKTKLTNANEDLKSVLPKDFAEKDVLHVADLVKDGKQEVAAQWVGKGDAQIQYIFAHLSDERSRHMGIIRNDLIQEIVSKHTPKEMDVQVTLVLDKQEQVFPAGCAVAKAFPLYSRKTAFTKLKARTVTVDFAIPGGVSDAQYKELQRVGNAIRFSARLLDTPTCELNSDTYLEEIKKVASTYKNVTLTTFRDTELQKKGMGGLWNVGKGAEFPPLLAILEYTPAKTSKKDFKLALVGKGIVYDSGGLSLKPTTSMCGMKGDMGGSASVLASFEALVAGNYEGHLYALLCIAENAIGPKAYKNDDIVQCFSGKTVEINNTDAEGRMVLADGVAYATQVIKPTHMVDLATLTGAQMICTGMKHAAIVSNCEEFENAVRQSGNASGDWVYPILYCPELLKKEFESKVADMKNSVKDRMNAQSSAAAHFIEDHFDPEWKGKWCHVDIAGPASKDDRGTGYGVALVVDLAKRLLQ